MNWSYIAGFVDGEGHILAQQPNDRYHQNRVCIIIGQKNPLPLEAIKAFLSKKGIEAQIRARKNIKPDGEVSGIFYVLEIQNADNVKRVLTKIKNYLILKRDKAEEALRIIKAMKRKRWYFLEDERLWIIEQYKRGISASRIATRFNTSRDVIYRVLREAGVPRRVPYYEIVERRKVARGYLIKDLPWEKIEELYRDGKISTAYYYRLKRQRRLSNKLVLQEISERAENQT